MRPGIRGTKDLAVPCRGRQHEDPSGCGHGRIRNSLIIKYQFCKSVETQPFFCYVSTPCFITHCKSKLPKTKRGRVPPPDRRRIPMSLNAHLPDLGQPPENAYLSCVKRPDLLTISSFFTTTCVENVLSCTGEWRNVFLTGISDRTCSRKMRRYRKQKKPLLSIRTFLNR